MARFRVSGKTRRCLLRKITPLSSQVKRQSWLTTHDRDVLVIWAQAKYWSLVMPWSCHDFWILQKCLHLGSLLKENYGLISGSVGCIWKSVYNYRSTIFVQLGHPNKMFRFPSPSLSWRWVGRSGKKKEWTQEGFWEPVKAGLLRTKAWLRGPVVHNQMV